MGNDDIARCIFPLTSLQIGDLQSYLSHLNIFLAAESNTFYILVDNRPWLEGLGSRRAHLWQLMVTKSRLSPFANSSARKGRKKGKEKLEKKASNKVTNAKKCTNSTNPKISERWFSLIDAATLSQKRALLPVKKLKYSLQLNRELHRTLFGLIIFEVSWDDVRGINYLNELQTDTSLAIETKYMRRWEFDSIMEAVGCVSSWFSGTDHEQNLLRDHLLSTVDEVFYDAEEDFSEEETTCFYDVAVDNSSSYGIPVGFDAFPTVFEVDTSILSMCIILPIFWACWEILNAPVRLILALFSFIAFVCTLVYEMFGELWSSACSLVHIASTTEATVTATYEVSMWRSLWNDLFSKVFRAVKSILHGFVAFFTACNRHRLSIYNHLKEFIQKLSRRHCRPQHIKYKPSSQKKAWGSTSTNTVT
ncbi:uncharacterized protein LOC104897000 isoform X3 [Beta vulgaris subsp. vulgaris]|uniref:uncharacterized protein LOC104897000 isoform X3 n=1 Tax=Beta vulgaris subsp. vulgaris TaxID=3555 RepID=UPI0020370FC5|nr:uncharacterized protein LOC104897000 isoform X3 [Beta vulgaris subsp. vulgaris]